MVDRKAYEHAFSLRMEVIPGADNGAININPNCSFGNWRKVVAANCPLGGGNRSTGWYAVERVGFGSREEAAVALAQAEWRDEPLSTKEALVEGEAILVSLGY